MSDFEYFSLSSSFGSVLFFSDFQCIQYIQSGVYEVEHSPPPLGGENKIKGFGDGEESQKLEKKEKRKILKIKPFW